MRIEEPLTPLQALIERRLKDLSINATEAARRVGAQRTFVADVLAGRKRTIRGDHQRLIANAIEVDVAEVVSAMEAGADARADVAKTDRKRFAATDTERLEWLLRGCFEELRFSEENSRSLAEALIKESRSPKADSTSENGRNRLHIAGSVLARHFSH
jgi:hypothetical protein